MSRVSSDPKCIVAALITNALALADQHGWTEVAIYLDQALIALTGKGIPPPV
jgi:hypothetical protein